MKCSIILNTGVFRVIVVKRVVVIQISQSCQIIKIVVSFGTIKISTHSKVNNVIIENLTSFCFYTVFRGFKYFFIYLKMSTCFPNLWSIPQMTTSAKDLGLGSEPASQEFCSSECQGASCLSCHLLSSLIRELIVKTQGMVAYSICRSLLPSVQAASGIWVVSQQINLFFSAFRLSVTLPFNKIKFLKGLRAGI